jgi:hypothetical protein
MRVLKPMIGGVEKSFSEYCPQKLRISRKMNFDLDNHENSSFFKKCWALGLIDFGEG